TIYFKGNDQNSTSVGNKTIENDEYIDFYKLYYSLAANQYTNTLTSSDITKIKNKIERYGSKKLIENSVSIYDIWLHLEVLSLLELESDNNDLLLKYINNLYDEHGFYKSYSEEENNLEPQSYLLSTKMSLEALSNLGKELSNEEKKGLTSWLIENFPNKLDKSYSVLCTNHNFK
ncbi:hypothetical protein HRF87_27925, partial [Bacillus sp. CRN 9]|nr:hypothetical protein [Bacillus sp. CRN 9]